jgi:hypothetical protein
LPQAAAIATTTQQVHLWIFGGIQDTHLQLPRHVVDTPLDLLGPFSSILDDILINLSLRCEASDLIRLWQATTRQVQRHRASPPRK